MIKRQSWNPTRDWAVVGSAPRKAKEGECHGRNDVINRIDMEWWSCLMLPEYGQSSRGSPYDWGRSPFKSELHHHFFS